MILLRLLLLEWLLLTGLWLFRIRLGKRRRRRLLLFQFLDALVRSSQLLLEQVDLLQGLLKLLF